VRACVIRSGRARDDLLEARVRRGPPGVQVMARAAE
jgi:hypothetical protein